MAVVELTAMSRLMCTYPAGREALLPEYSAQANPSGASLVTTDRQEVRIDGLIHASIVIPVVRSRDAASLTVTHALVPSNESAPPNLPAVVRVAPEIVPTLP